MKIKEVMSLNRACCTPNDSAQMVAESCVIATLVPYRS